MKFPLQKTTSSEFGVLFALGAFLCISGGAVATYVASRAAGLHEAHAGDVMRGGVISLGMGFLCGFLGWFFGRFNY